MSQLEYIETLKTVFSYGLPGEEAHIPLLPLGRKTGLSQINGKSNVRKSAVALNLFYDSGWKSLLIQRPNYSGIHSGQVCLPGGSIEPEDESLISTALRECEEETGILRHELDLIGELTPVYIPVSNFLVQPYVFALEKPPLLIPDEREVDEIFLFDIDKELKSIEVQYTDIAVSKSNVLKKVPYFSINNKVVWGATALILNEMREVLKRL
jgi:8-oxo-dGTP pyrophosphatase MutT (NUDIX family)